MSRARVGARLSAMAAAALLLAACAARQPQQRVESRQWPEVTRQAGDVMIHQFPNRLTLLHRRNTTNEIMAVACLSRPGANADPDDKVGRTHLLMRTLPKGTKTRSSDEIAEILEGMGVRFGASDSYDYVGVGMQCVRPDFAAAMDVMADVVRNPTFPLQEIEGEKERIYGEIQAREDRTPSATLKRFREALLGPGPYGRSLEGERETVRLLTQTDLVAAYQEAFRPENMVIAIVGNMDFEEAKAAVAKHFGDMPSLGLPYAEARKSYLPSAQKVDFSRDVEQGFVAMGCVTAPLDSADAPAIDITSAILGQGMSARLFRELRDKRGLAYAVGALNTQYRHTGMFAVYIGTTPENVRESVAQHGDPLQMFDQPGMTPMDWAASALWAEVENLSREPVPAEELERARSYLIGGYLRSHEANAQQAQFLAYWHLMGLGVEYDEKYPELLRAVTSRDVMRVANKYLHSPTITILRPQDAAPRAAR